jgi:N-acetylmuramoyl-L-alanine amidase
MTKINLNLEPTKQQFNEKAQRWAIFEERSLTDALCSRPIPDEMMKVAQRCKGAKKRNLCLCSSFFAPLPLYAFVLNYFSRSFIPFFCLLLVLASCSTPEVRYIPIPPKVINQPKEVSIAEPKRPYKPQQLGPVIMIDPGHGGPNDTGAKGRLAPDYMEKNLTLATAMFLKDYLNQMGFKTLMVRQEDIFINRYVRARLANEKQPKLYVSIHYNFAPHHSAHGIEVFYYQNDADKERSNRSKRLGEAVLKRVITKTGAKSRGVKNGNYAVIRETNMPAVIVEGGFMTNEQEMNKLKDPAYLKKIALGIAEGVHDYLSRDK